MTIHYTISLLTATVLLAGMLPVEMSAQETCAALPHLQKLLEHQQAAWNQGDGAAWSAAFTEDADFVNIRGDAFQGRAAITEQHRRILGGPFQGSHATITIRQCTDLTPDVALIETVHEVTGFKFLPPGITATSDGVLQTRMKYVAVKHGQDWHFAAAQNTAILPASAMPKR